MKQYHDYLKWILADGIPKGDRTGTGTTSAFGGRMEFDLSKGFPLVTTKKVNVKAVFAELLPQPRLVVRGLLLAGDHHERAGQGLQEVRRAQIKDCAGDLHVVLDRQAAGDRAVLADVEVGQHHVAQLVAPDVL